MANNRTYLDELIKRNPVLLSGAVEYDTAWTGEHITT